MTFDYNQLCCSIFVMREWGKTMGCEGANIKMISDGNTELSKVRFKFISACSCHHQLCSLLSQLLHWQLLLPVANPCRSASPSIMLSACFVYHQLACDHFLQLFSKAAVIFKPAQSCPLSCAHLLPNSSTHHTPQILHVALVSKN